MAARERRARRERRDVYRGGGVPKHAHRGEPAEQRDLHLSEEHSLAAKLVPVLVVVSAETLLTLALLTRVPAAGVLDAGAVSEAEETVGLDVHLPEERHRARGHELERLRDGFANLPDPLGGDRAEQHDGDAPLQRVREVRRVEHDRGGHRGHRGGSTERGDGRVVAQREVVVRHAPLGRFGRPTRKDRGDQARGLVISEARGRGAGSWRGRA